MNVLIAGGTGLIGRKLEEKLQQKGFLVSVLTRHPKRTNEFKWDPQKKEIDFTDLASIDVLINLSGAGIADKRWTEERKKELHQSRIGTNEFLFSLIDQMSGLKQFVSSSGINCYGYQDDKIYTESDSFGTDYLSQLVKVWEESADLFASHAKVAKIRTAVVLDDRGGALQKMSSAVKIGVGSPLGSGTQMMPWIHQKDLIDLFIHVIENQLDGSYNAVAHCDSNKQFMSTLAKTLGKPFFFPNVPAFVMKVMLGEMAVVLLDGLQASNEKIRKSGFKFQFTNLEDALNDLLN